MSISAEAQRLSQTGSFTWDFDRGELLWSEELCRIFEFDPATTITTDLVETVCASGGPAGVRGHA